MKIAEIKVKLTDKDVLEAISEYVKVENFQVEEISFEDIIEFSCSYKKGLKFQFKVKIEIDHVEDNILYFKVIDINIAKIHIINGIKNYALKKLLNDFQDQGINIDKETISVNLNDILKKVPQVDFKLSTLYTLNGEIQVTVENLTYTNDKIVETVEAKLEEKKVESDRRTIEDNYTNLRRNLYKKIPEKYIDLAEYAFMIPDIIILMGRLLKDQRVGIKSKVVIGSIVAYYASPIDFAILFIPFIGEVSALALAFYGLSYVVQEISENIIMDNWQGKEASIQKMKNAVAVVNSAAGGRNVSKLIGFSKKIYKK